MIVTGLEDEFVQIPDDIESHGILELREPAVARDRGIQKRAFIQGKTVVQVDPEIPGKHVKREFRVGGDEGTAHGGMLQVSRVAPSQIQTETLPV